MLNWWQMARFLMQMNICGLYNLLFWKQAMYKEHKHKYHRSNIRHFTVDVTSWTNFRCITFLCFIVKFCRISPFDGWVKCMLKIDANLDVEYIFNLNLYLQGCGDLILQFEQELSILNFLFFRAPKSSTTSPRSAPPPRSARERSTATCLSATTSGMRIGSVPSAARGTDVTTTSR